MKNTVMNLTINNTNYTDVPMDIARAIAVMLKPYETEANTPKAEPKRTKVYAKCADGKSVTIGGDGFIPTKVFKGVTYSLKQSGAKYNADTKAWTFETKKACTDWCKAQDAR